MVATKIPSNKNVGFFAAPISAVNADFERLTLTELQGLVNYSEAIKWDGFELGIQASEQDEDRALTDSDGAATRGYENFGGAVSAFSPVPNDTSSIVRRARNLLSTSHTELVTVVRDGIPASTPWAAGQVYNGYHVVTDARNEQRGDKNRFFSVNLKAKGRCIVNGIVPSAVPTAVAITGGATVATGATLQLRAAYEGRDITIGARWVSSDESKAIVTVHGIVIPVAAGTVSISATYPGSAAGVAKSITVS